MAQLCLHTSGLLSDQLGVKGGQAPRACYRPTQQKEATEDKTKENEQRKQATAQNTATSSEATEQDAQTQKRQARGDEDKPTKGNQSRQGYACAQAENSC